MELWIFVTLAASAVQTLRFLLQKRLKGIGLSTGGATFSRFLFAAPLAALAALALIWVSGDGLPGLRPGFWAFAIAGGLGQIIGTFCTVALFSERSFAVGIAFTKSETLLVAAFSALILGEAVSALGLVAILIGVAGVLWLSRIAAAGFLRGLFSRAMALGLLAGALLGVAAVGYRGAVLAVEGGDVLLRAVVALTLVTGFQTLVMALWLFWREPGQMALVLRHWRATAPVGATGVAGSLGWFVAFGLQHAAYVRALAQVELLFGLMVSVFWFRERASRTEAGGMALLLISLVMIILAA
jgi:drug/metabolite transporter (DMT)-like permease